MTKPIDEILAPKAEARLRIYVYSIDDDGHRGLLKVGKTKRAAKPHIAEHFGVDVRTISENLRSVFDSGELTAEAVIGKFRTTAADGKACLVGYYKLDAAVQAPFALKGRNPDVMTYIANLSNDEVFTKGRQ